MIALSVDSVEDHRCWSKVRCLLIDQVKPVWLNNSIINLYIYVSHFFLRQQLWTSEIHVIQGRILSLNVPLRDKLESL